MLRRRERPRCVLHAFLGGCHKILSKFSDASNTPVVANVIFKAETTSKCLCFGIRLNKVETKSFSYPDWHYVRRSLPQMRTAVRTVGWPSLGTRTRRTRSGTSALIPTPGPSLSENVSDWKVSSDLIVFESLNVCNVSTSSLWPYVAVVLAENISAFSLQEIFG